MYYTYNNNNKRTLKNQKVSTNKSNYFVQKQKHKIRTKTLMPFQQKDPQKSLVSKGILLD